MMGFWVDPESTPIVPADFVKIEIVAGQLWDLRAHSKEKSTNAPILVLARTFGAWASTLKPLAQESAREAGLDGYWYLGEFIRL